jgi:hypothetical protein
LSRSGKRKRSGLSYIPSHLLLHKASFIRRNWIEISGGFSKIVREKLFSESRGFKLIYRHLIWISSTPVIRNLYTIPPRHYCCSKLLHYMEEGPYGFIACMWTIEWGVYWIGVEKRQIMKK